MTNNRVMIGLTFIFLPIARDVIKHILCSDCFFFLGGGGAKGKLERGKMKARGRGR